MPELHLVRHGRAAAGWGQDADPGLDEVGRAQADAVAAALDAIGPRPILCSPLRRTRQTAAPLAERWGVTPLIEPAVGEIPSPTDDLAARAAWLPGALGGLWSDLDEQVTAWRAALVAALLAPRVDTVVFTHFVAINAAVGWAGGDDRVCGFRPGNCSVTVLETDPDRGVLRVVRLGGQGVTAVS